MTHSYHIFCDASFHPKHKFGVGGFFLCLDQDLIELAAAQSLRIDVQVVTAHDTNNTSMEILTVLAALDVFKANYFIPNKTNGLGPMIYTDCKAVCDLMGRREKLLARNFQSQKTGALLKNYALYQRFYELYDELRPTLIWVKGHSPSKQHDHIQKIFSFVDQSVRRELRNYQLKP